MSRWWTELVAALGDVVPLSLVALLLVLAAGLVAAGWYWWPAWVPRRWPRLRPLRWPQFRLRRPGWDSRLRWPRWRWPWRRKRDRGTPEPVAVPTRDDELPDLPAAAFVSLADRLAAQGRYAEAVRERLRAMVRELVDRRVVEHRPGWTVTELAGAAARTRPAIDAPLREAGGVFSDLWYGQRPATERHDQRMRELSEQLHRGLS